MNTSLPVVHILRHRLSTDGVGVTTLVGSSGCPLHCRYCINESMIRQSEKITNYTPLELYEKLRIDNLYFQATGGGVTFGGGEPLLHAAFIHDFAQLCPSEWHINIETSLNIKKDLLTKVLHDVDLFIIDVKDFNPQTYEAYTSQSFQLMFSNLKLLLKLAGPDKLHLRVPLIPNYNTKEDVQKTATQLKQLGCTQIEIFPYIIREVKFSR